MSHHSHSLEHHRTILQGIARTAMLDRGFRPDFPPEVFAQLRDLDGRGNGEPHVASSGVRDLTALLWCSVDNDDSRDLDQLTVADPPEGKVTTIRVAIADVDQMVAKDSPLDDHARHNTTSVYTAARIFPMLPEQLSTDLTSLNPGEQRLTVVVEMAIDGTGAVQRSQIYRALVRNHAKLAYRSVARWLEGEGDAPPALAAVAGLAENLRLQDRVAQALKQRRHAQGALTLETTRAKPVFDGDQVSNLEDERANRATEIIENFMIAANGVTASFLEEKQFPSIRRVVRTPKRWERIVDVAREHGASLPDTPDSAALDRFLVAQKAADPESFADLSLAVIKLLGAGEYMADKPGQGSPGHFGLAVKDYAHSTAPNRRYTDLVTQRLLKAAIAGDAPPYEFGELEVLARHLTEAEDAANKVERQVAKSAAAMLLEARIGQQFTAIVTGASDKGTYARLLSLPVEGRVVRGFERLDVGDRIEVRLTAVNVERGFIDFAAVTNGRRS